MMCYTTKNKQHKSQCILVTNFILSMHLYGYRAAVLSETMGLNISSLGLVNITAGESISL